MKNRIYAAISAILAVGLVSAAALQAHAAPATIVEHSIGGSGTNWPQPVGITTGANGDLYAVEDNENNIDQLSASGALLNKFAITTPTSDPRYIASGSDGNLWFTECGANQIGEMSPSGTMLNEFALNTSLDGTCPFWIIAGPDGNLWFSTVSHVVKMTTSGTFTPYSTPGSPPWEIAKGADGNIWFNENGANTIGYLTTSGVETTVGTTPSGSFGLAEGADGNLWFTESGANVVGKMTPSGTVTTYPVPTSSAAPHNMAAGPDGNLWFTETGANQIGYVTTAGVVKELAIPTGSSAPSVVTAGSNGNVWFTESKLAVPALIGEVVLPAKPTLNAQAKSVATHTSITVNVVSGIANDPAASTLSIVTNPSHGTASVNTTNGTITYTSNAGFVGTDSLVYQVCSADDNGECSQATLTFNVTVAAPDTGFGVALSSPLKSLGIYSIAAVVLVASGLLIRRHAQK